VYTEVVSILLASLQQVEQCKINLRRRWPGRGANRRARSRGVADDVVGVLRGLGEEGHGDVAGARRAKTTAVTHDLHTGNA
jgi:hypothetical protein